jgi:hypothetical protein
MKSWESLVSWHWNMTVTGMLFTNFVRSWVISNFSVVFTKIIKCFIKRGYDPTILRHTACLVFNQFTVARYAFLFWLHLTDQVGDTMIPFGTGSIKPSLQHFTILPCWAFFRESVDHYSIALMFVFCLASSGPCRWFSCCSAFL